MGSTRSVLRLFGAALVVVIASACGSALLPERIVVGRYPAEPPALWERTLGALRQAGYEPMAASATRGQLAVAARAARGTYGATRFELSLYREGWVVVRIESPLVTPDGRGRVRVPADLAREYETLLRALEQRLEVREDRSREEQPS